MSISLCMPVGPAGIKGETAQFMCSLVASRLVDRVFISSGHLIRARNSVWSAAVLAGASRVLWLDSDVWTTIKSFEQFANRAEDWFLNDENVAWYGAVCMRRGPEPLVNVCSADRGWRAGLGMALWNVARAMQGFALVGNTTPFRWIEPLGEDYRACDDLHDNGFTVAIDPQCPTWHVDVGHWPGGGNELLSLIEEMSNSKQSGAV